MTKAVFGSLLCCLILYNGRAQLKASTQQRFHSQYFGVQVGLTLLENPFVLYPVTNLCYSKTIVGRERHQLAVLNQFGAIFLPDIETKILMSSSFQYKYISKKRFEANVFLGINYQLRRLAYNRYEYVGNALKNKGGYEHQCGPTSGLNVGYKIIKKKRYSITPTFGVSLIKLNRIYHPNLFIGYKPSAVFGLTFNR
jgi:hypothetical protein